MRYLPDGTPIPSHISTEEKRQNEHRTMYGLYRGVIIKSVYPDDPQNINKERMEYTVKIRGQLYSNVVMMRDGGGVYNYHERVAKGTEKSFTGQVRTGTYDENLDGESVYVLFLEGYVNVPVIVGFMQHPKQAKYKKLKKSDGLLDIMEFNGLEISIDKDSNYLIKQVGRKDANGKILNPGAVGSRIKIKGDGDIEFFAKDQHIELKAPGITETVTGNWVVNVSGNANITVDGNATVHADGNATVDAGSNATVNAGSNATVSAGSNATVSAGSNISVTAGGNITEQGAQISMNGSAGMVLTTATDPVIDLITGAPTTGVPTVKAG